MEAVTQHVCFANVTPCSCVRIRPERAQSRANVRVCLQGLKGRNTRIQSPQSRKEGSLEKDVCLNGSQHRKVWMPGLQQKIWQAQISVQRRCGCGLQIRMGMHPEWRQVDNKIRRLEHRIADFRITSNDLRIQRRKIGFDDPEINQVKLMEHIEKREKEVMAEREALQKEMEHLTVYFHKGAEPEYRGLRRFFLSYLYHTCSKAFENFPADEFDRVLSESAGGISFEWPERGVVTFPHHLCQKILIGKKISISASGLDTSPLAIALAVLQAGSQKHCDDPSCRREECHILKEDYEQLFEAFFKKRIRPLINQKSRGEMSIQYDATLKIERVSRVKVS